MKKDYVQIYGDTVRQFRELNPKAGPKLQRHHIWPTSLGGAIRLAFCETKDDDEIGEQIAEIVDAFDEIAQGND